jgi:hypothetical protein
MKFFQHPLLADFKKTKLVPAFEKVIVEKPKESRSGEFGSGRPIRKTDLPSIGSESSEAYFVCLGYRGE